MTKLYTCRLCLEDETTRKNLVYPCKCKGTQKYIHKACLKRMTAQWDKCPTCYSKYKSKPKFRFEMNIKKLLLYIFIIPLLFVPILIIRTVISGIIWSIDNSPQNILMLSIYLFALSLCMLTLSIYLYILLKYI